ncbi:hypothetical protein [Flagellimonas algicola]|uniref:Lipoprotein n=1 Tax=Flagellimonas algicola TaxID=2583815 RepID=A0ABY2WM35_9FLAO|nr:hypothetical protein [Allomuricauda algicola]TMU55655.1 hypothetical protein FGG15_15940 [Allomuricauda algicola]
MRPTITVLLLALLLSACGPMRNLQKVETRIPCLGSVGKSSTTLFTKDFQKAGEPSLDTPLEVSLNVFDFSQSTLSKYRKFKERQGVKATDSLKNSTQAANSKYYKLRVSDLVGLKAQLNAAKNLTLKEYLQDDSDLEVLTGISFVAKGGLDSKLRTAHHFYLKESRGTLVLEAHNGKQFSTIEMAGLEIFDFETSQLCWKRNHRGKLEIATITDSGSRCPGDTEKDPNKLDSTKNYLKL